jgi:hypothetical protein
MTQINTCPKCGHYSHEGKRCPAWVTSRDAKAGILASNPENNGEQCDCGVEEQHEEKEL